MASAIQKITLSPSRDIPFDKLVLSQSNVRRVKAGLSIEDLAEDIGQRTLLQSLNVRPMRDADGAETGLFEVPAGGRRFRALQLLVKQKRMSKTQVIPCIVREGSIAEEDSLAENVHRVALHPLDQFRAFQTLRKNGLSEDDIAARFFVAPAIVKQRLKLAAASETLLDLYAEDEMTLEQLMAFTVTNDHARQEQVWKGLSHAFSKEPYHIRRLLTETAVRAYDRRARFVGIDAYEAAGGFVLRDLFHEDNGGWLEDVALLDLLVADKLKSAAEQVGAEGWKWIEAAIEFPYGHDRHLRVLDGVPADLSPDEQTTLDMLHTEYGRPDERRMVSGICHRGADPHARAGRHRRDGQPQLNQHARLTLCGLASQYGNMDGDMIGAWQAQAAPVFSAREVTAHRLFVGDFVASHQEQFLADMAGWLKDRRITYREDIRHGLETAPEAFRAMLSGGSFGKALVQVSIDPTRG